MAVFLSHSPEETLLWAEKYAAGLGTGDVVLLDGEMGAGKTVLAKGIARGLGIADEVTSPTYAYINSYGGKLFHFDCYRVEDESFAERLGFAEYFDAGGICLVEWGDRIRGLLPPGCKRVGIAKLGDALREIRY